MLEQLQHAYEKALKNIVFVDFVNRKVVGGLDSLELEFAKEKSCCKDVITAINYHFAKGDFDLAKERIEALNNRIEYIKRLESHLKSHRRNRLFEIASHFEKREKASRAVMNDANPS